MRIYSEVELQEKIAGAREKAREARERSESEYKINVHTSTCTSVSPSVPESGWATRFDFGLIV